MAKKEKRPTQKQTRRQEVRAARQRRQRLQQIGLVAVGVLLLGAVVWAALSSRRPGAIPGDRIVADEGQNHVSTDQRVTYRSNPPSSGPHYSSPASWGYHSDEVLPEVWIHNLEHGGVVFVYHCPDGCPDLQGKLETLAGKLPNSKYETQKIVVTSYAGELPGEVTALAWNHQLDLPAYDADLLTRFYQRYVDRGPEDVP